MLLQEKEVAKNNVIADLSLQHGNDNVKTRWIFIPPYAPNLGGLWEAAVKSTKFNLKRILVYLSFIKSSASSIASLSESPDNYTYLRPSHFLIGRKIIAPIEPQLSEEKILPTKRWQLEKKVVSRFLEIMEQ
jgi:hypothetical protein